ncbi:MAG: OsmC family protein [Candidatus Hermodarchaeota archaeon]
MVREETSVVNLKLEKDLIFKVNLGYDNVKELIIDETMEEKSKQKGPDAAELLAMAILSCLNASFIFCLQKRNLSVEDLEARAEVSFKKIERGYVRIKKIDVKIVPKSNDPLVIKRVNQCIKKMKNENMFFEESCIITESVRQGIEVNVDIEL